jgi:hypothetical protein
MGYHHTNFCSPYDVTSKHTTQEISLSLDKKLTIPNTTKKNMCKNPQHKGEEIFNINMPPPL